MSAYVFTDQALAKHAGRFVWLFVDVDDADNADFLGKFEITSLPTLLVIDRISEKVALQWFGSATVPQLERLFDDAERALGDEGGDPAENALVRADRLNGARDFEEAALEYEQALHLAPPDWSRRDRVLESLVFSLEGSGQLQRCAEVAAEQGAQLPRGPSFANAVSLGLYCALSGPEAAEWRAGMLAALETLVQESLNVEGVLADDRSSHYQLLVMAREVADDSDAVQKIAAAWLAFLEEEASRAPTVEARASFDSHRLSAALKLGDPQRVIPALRASEQDLPDDYNPCSRLAAAYLALDAYEDALGAVNRALEKVYGPRKLRVFMQKAEVLEKMGAPDKAAGVLAEALAYSGALPESQRSPQREAQLRTRLETLKQ